jgi:hypothetical protein
MAKTRSPEYPAMGLKEAIEKVKAVYEKDYQNKLPKAVMATHMGYKGLNGTSLPALSALSKYGLIEGRGDDTRVSDLGLAIVAHAPGTPERTQALRAAASAPELFAELNSKFPGGKASDAAIRSYLLTQRFIPSAADTAIRSYRETIQLVEAESGGYDSSPVAEDGLMQAQGEAQQGAANVGGKSSVTVDATVTRKAVFTLDEGDVVIQFPKELSKASVDDLADYLETFMKRARREAKDEAAN